MAATFERVLGTYSLTDRVYVLGSFEKGVTVYNQQVRALNLAWSMVEDSGVNGRQALSNVAVVGGGIAGLTIAAALLKKGVPKITLFERRAVLCPLQRGSDTRWLHPHIYEWPGEGTENPVAGLPIMNWKAGRASDVAFQIVNAWKRLKRGTLTKDYAGPLNAPKSEVLDTLESRVTEVLPVSYLKIRSGRRIEWVCSTPSPEATEDSTNLRGDTRVFSSIVLALGYGDESGISEVQANLNPYWRNESLGQPHLSPGTKNYVISGFGDGAIVDLCRVRISAFRQDRTLWDLFAECPKLRRYLKDLKRDMDADGGKSLYQKLAALPTSTEYKSEFAIVLSGLRQLLRLDTSVVLATGDKRRQSFTDVFRGPASFQNRVLMYLLFRVGGFVPSQHDAASVQSEYQSDDGALIIRHGTQRMKLYAEVLTSELSNECVLKLKKFESRKSSQSKDVHWTGGYWDTPARMFHLAKPGDKEAWRQEYLPALTQAICSAFASSIAGLVDAADGVDNRVTLHRLIRVAKEVLLQQSCDYFGNSSDRKFSRRRTFSINEGTIGLAVRSARVCYSAPAPKLGNRAYAAALQRDMGTLNLGHDSMKMSSSVLSLLAIPFLRDGEVIAVLYADSQTRNLFDRSVLESITAACRGFAASLTQLDRESLTNIEADISLYTGRRREITAAKLGPRLEVLQARTFAELDLAPVNVSPGTRRINFEITDFRI